MIKRLKKDDWKHALLMISDANRFRPIIVEGGAVDSDEDQKNLHLLGIQVEEQENGVKLNVYGCRLNHPATGILLGEISSPGTVSISDSDDGLKSISITHSKSKKFHIIFTGAQSSEMRSESIAKVAYFLFERRGGFGGSDLEDWADAERLFADWERLIELRFL